MLSKENRLKKKKDFERVLREGRGFKEDFLIFKFIKNNLNQSRFGFIISLKVSKKATLRNKIKRQLREIVRKKLQKIKEGIDVLLITQPGFENRDFFEIEEILNKIFLKAKILK